MASVLLLLIAAWSTLTFQTASDTGDTGGPNNVWPIVALIGGVLVIVSFLAYRVRRRSLRAASADREPKERARASSDAPTWPAPVRPAPPSLDSSFEPSVPDGRAVAFVSYATEDEHSVVRELVACLRSVVEVWFAPEDVGVGQQWLFAISDALENANFFVVVITKNSMSSPWVRQELSAAFRRSVESGSPLLVPVLAEPCDYPILLGNFQMIDATMLSREQTRERLVAAVG